MEMRPKDNEQNTVSQLHMGDLKNKDKYVMESKWTEMLTSLID